MHSQNPGALTALLSTIVALAGPLQAQEDVPDKRRDPELQAILEDAEAETREPTDDDGLTGTVSRGTSLASGALAGSLERLNALNPRITVFGDFLGRTAIGSDKLVEEEDGELIQLDNKFRLREVELDLRADVDPYAKGLVIFAVEHEAANEFEAIVEEGYVWFEALPYDISTLNFRARAGRFRTTFGRANQLHLHDLMWSEYPLATQDFLGEEGDIQDAVELRWLAPGFPLELTGAIMNGENGTVLADADSEDPAYLGRAEIFIEITDTMFATFGGSFLCGHSDADADQDTELYGADFLFKWAPDRYRSIVLLGELYYTDREQPGRTEQHAPGGYAAIQVQPMQHWYLGGRYDQSDFFEGAEETQWAVSGWLSYYFSEFLRLRVGLEHRERPTTADGEPDLDTLFIQLTFIFGSHPVEPFWFNR